MSTNISLFLPRPKWRWAVDNDAVSTICSYQHPSNLGVAVQEILMTICVCSEECPEQEDAIFSEIHTLDYDFVKQEFFIEFEGYLMRCRLDIKPLGLKMIYGKAYVKFEKFADARRFAVWLQDSNKRWSEHW